MPNFTIYINRNNTEKLKKLNKSGLINQLLAEYFLSVKT